MTGTSRGQERSVFALLEKPSFLWHSWLVTIPPPPNNQFAFLSYFLGAILSSTALKSNPEGSIHIFPPRRLADWLAGWAGVVVSISHLCMVFVTHAPTEQTGHHF